LNRNHDRPDSERVPPPFIVGVPGGTHTPAGWSWIVDQDRQTGTPADAGDVVEGPVGSAAIKDPATNPGIGADLDELPAVETDGDDPDQTDPPAER
jgi:hypothetical protein